MQDTEAIFNNQPILISEKMTKSQFEWVYLAKLLIGRSISCKEMVSERLENRAKELEKNAKGNIKAKRLLSSGAGKLRRLLPGTYLHDEPIIEYFKENENPHYFFYNESKGVQIGRKVEKSGWSGDYRNAMWITDIGVHFTVGNSEGDFHYLLSYDSIQSVEASDGLGKNNFVFETDEGQVEFPSTPNADVRPAEDFIQDKIPGPSDIEAEIDALIDEVRTARVQGRKEHALNILDDVSELLDRYQQFRETGDFQGSSSLEEISSLKQQIKREQWEDELHSDLDSHKKSIAASLRVGQSEVNLTLSDEHPLEAVVEVHKRLHQALKTVKKLQQEFTEFPWTPLHDELKRFATGEAQLPFAKFDKFCRIITNGDKVLRYLQTAPGYHPSIDAEEWREAVSVALEEQFPEILDPIAAHIDRLGSQLWGREHLYEFTWEEFEQIIGELYRDLGFDVEVTQGTADLGIDVWAESELERIAIQVKQYDEGNAVGRKTLQQLLSTVARGEADKAVVVTSGDYAHTAEQYAADTPAIQLIDGAELIELLSESKIPPPV